MRYTILYTKQYKKALRRISKRDKLAVSEIEKIINLLAQDEILSPRHKDHHLTGEMKSFREIHVRPDLLLVYQKNEDILILLLVNISSHSDLF